MTDGYKYSLEATWRIQSTAPIVIGERFLRTLDLVTEAVPEIGAWLIGEHLFEEPLIPVDEARRRIGQLVEDNVATFDGVREPDRGYWLHAYSRRDLSPKSIFLGVAAGGKFGDRISFRVGSMMEPSDLEAVTYRLFRAATLAIIDQWPPVWANARLYWPNYDKDPPVADIPPHPRTSFHMPWLSYLCGPLAEGLNPPSGVPCERTPDGGLLMIAADERLDPTNPEHMRRSRAIAEVMVSRAGDPPRPGYWPLDEEWPPSPETLRKRGPPSA